MAQTQKVGRRHTKVIKGNDGTLTVQYHGTDVVLTCADGSILLNTGGWKSVTTKTRMNQAAQQFKLGYNVYQEKGEWFVLWKGEILPFSDYSIVLR